MDDISDIKNDLTAIKSVTDKDGRIKAWVDKIDVQTETINLHINTALDEEIIETFENPTIWDDRYAIVDFVNQSGIDIELIDNIYDLEIRYDPEKDDIETVDDEPKSSQVDVKDDIFELAKLKENTIDNKWVESEIQDVNVQEDSVFVESFLPNTGKITFEYNRPQSWKDKYAIVQLCNRLGVNSAEQLVGKKVAVSPISKNHNEISHTPFYDPKYEVESERNTENNKFSLVPISYTEGGIPSKESEKSEKTRNKKSSNIQSLISTLLLMLITVLLVSSFASTMSGVTEEISEPVSEVEINEQNESIKITIEHLIDDNEVIIKDGKETVGVVDGNNVAYTYEPDSKSGTVKLIRKDKSTVFSKVDYNFD